MQLAPGGPAGAVQPESARHSPDKAEVADGWCLEESGRRGHPARVRRLVGHLELQAGHRAFFSDAGLPNFLPTFLGGGTNGILHGDFGYSISTGRPVLDMIGERFPATTHPDVTAFVIWVAIAIVLGVIAAVKRYSLFDQSVTLFSYIFYSLPTFWLGLILIYVFAVGAALAALRRASSTPQRAGAFNTPPVLDAASGQQPVADLVDIGQTPGAAGGHARGGQRRRRQPLRARPRCSTR